MQRQGDAWHGICGLCCEVPQRLIDSGARREAVKPCNLHIIRTLQLVDEMITLADQGDSDREDNGCGILFGVLRDSAFKLKKLAETEKHNHIRKGWWADENARDNEH